MKLTLPLLCTLLGLLSSSVRAETVVRILHIQSVPKIVAIWEEAAKKYESANPGVDVQFNYLENEAFKAKLPTLLQSKDRPSAFHSWGGGVMYEQVAAGICKDITNEIARGGLTRPFIRRPRKISLSTAKPGVPNDLAPMVFWYNKELWPKRLVSIRRRSNNGRTSSMLSKRSRRRESRR